MRSTTRAGGGDAGGGRRRPRVDHLELAGAAERPGDPVGRHLAERVEARVARLVLERRHDDAPRVEGRVGAREHGDEGRPGGARGGLPRRARGDGDRHRQRRGDPAGEAPACGRAWGDGRVA
jgi:hypothetical protein